MRTGIFCVYENPLGDYRRCFDDQTALVKKAEALGFEEAWVAEHHFNPASASPSILPLLAYLAGVTSRIRIGSAAVLLAFRNPIQVAEDVATIDILSGGRFDFGVAKGGPFPAQNRHFHVDTNVSRDMTMESIELIERLFYEESVTFSGQYYSCEDVSLAPRPIQQPVPIYVATTTEATIRLAAERGYSVMGGSPFPLERLVRIVETYREASPDKDPKMTVARFYYAAPTREEAVAEALPFIARFADRVRGVFAAQNPQGPGIDTDTIVERSLIGSYCEVQDKIARLQELTGMHSLLLKPVSLDPQKWLTSLDDYAERIKPGLPS
ncbi:LLM class flavin-dependent oxidoreductase [Rhodomicrobium sp. Az07]|uniref:LLM class flavin-dependent oxidoreductase n=1 Tax=Rhodomicrobium sp. Az07 TaxID=2839034 RepID=UPI001BE66A8E|nr:LLM class flavin-dependent oxidoreductase [Rhodomicrobium sp. Az07]MBT3071263.1 LLM class flavin-dependent oxidoreductase [Rhodomicrobium sp. Az07]